MSGCKYYLASLFILLLLTILIGCSALLPQRPRPIFPGDKKENTEKAFVKPAKEEEKKSEDKAIWEIPDFGPSPKLKFGK